MSCTLIKIKTQSHEYYQTIGTLKFEEGFEIQFLKSKSFNAVVLWDYSGPSVSDNRHKEVAEFARLTLERYAQIYNSPEEKKRA